MDEFNKAVTRGFFKVVLVATVILFVILYLVMQLVGFEAAILFGIAILLVEIGMIALAIAMWQK